MKSLLVVALLLWGSHLVSSSEPFIIPATVVEGREDTCPTEQQREDVMEVTNDQVWAALRKRLGCTTDMGSLQSNPAGSCREIYQSSPLCPSGSYWLRGNNGTAVEVYCNMNHTACCNSTGGGWTRIAQLDMRDPTQNCPEGWRYIEDPKRLCGRNTNGGGCESVVYSTYGMNYTRICGRVLGYQYASPDGFEPYSRGGQPTVDGIYVDGVSITHGSNPRQHVWTFVSGLGERIPHNSCPCAGQSGTENVVIPDYVGEDYFCELSNGNGWVGTLFHEDPLWDGADCETDSQCCEFNNPPWFCKQLDQSTTDSIEVRLCGEQTYGDEDTPLELIELYIL